jgi:hypothetical protein
MCTTALRLSGVDQLITGSLITTDMLRPGNMNASKLKPTLKLMLGLDARLIDARPRKPRRDTRLSRSANVKSVTQRSITNLPPRSTVATSMSPKSRLPSPKLQLLLAAAVLLMRKAARSKSVLHRRPGEMR